MAIIREWGNIKIRQNEDDGYFSVDDIVVASNDGKSSSYYSLDDIVVASNDGNSSSYYSLDDWMQLGISALLASRDRKLLYIPWFSRDEENCLYVCSLLAEAFANKNKKFSLAAAIASDSWNIDKEKLKHSRKYADINDEKPKPLMDSNDFHFFANTISYLEETQNPEDMELARLLRGNLRSKI